MHRWNKPYDSPKNVKHPQVESKNYLAILNLKQIAPLYYMQGANIHLAIQ